MSEIIMDDTNLSFDDLEKKYRNFLAPAFEVIIDGTNVLQESVAITKISVDTTVDPKADSFSLQIGNAYDLVKREFKWLDEYFGLGKYIEIRMGYTDKLSTVFYGLITSISVNYPSGGSPVLAVQGMDISFLMMKGIHSETWNDLKHSDVVKIIGERYVSKFYIDETKDKLKHIVQNALEDFHFLTYLAEENNYDFFIVGNALYFREKLKNKEPLLTLTYGKNLRSFITDVNIARQVSQVIVRGWDELNHQVIEAKSEEIDILGSNSKTGKDIVKVLGDFTKEYVYTNIDSLQEAQEKANSILNKRSMELIMGQGESIGLPEIRAGKYIQFAGLGTLFNQPLYLKSVNHTIDQAGYVTRFTVGGNAI